MSDWRADYVVCEHIAADEHIEARHMGFRVCCTACCDAGFLISEDLVVTDAPGGLAIGKVDPDLKADPYIKA